MKNMLKQLRGNKTQKEIAEAIGITTSYYGMLEIGARNPSLDIAIKLSNYFKKPTNHIFFDE